MKIALVHELLHKYGGAERVLQVLADMFPDAPIYTLVYDEKKVGHIFPKQRVITSYLQRYFRFIKRPQPFLSKMSQAIESFDFSGYDLVISSSSAFAHGILTPLKTKHICYCHSPMRYAWDYTHQYRNDKSGGFFGGIKNFLISKTLREIRIWDKVASDRPDLYLSNAKTVQKRLQKYYQLSSEVVYPPVDISRFTSQKSSSQSYFLIVSALTRFKRIDLAINVFNQLKLPLYIIGGGQDEKYLKSLANSNIKFLGRCSDEDVQKYMEQAYAFIFPGEDDFGITPVESMAAGTPILAYAKGGALETVQAGVTGEFFDQQTIESLSNGVKRLVNNYDSYDIKKLRLRATDFSKQKFIDNIKKIVMRVMTDK